VIELHFS